MKRLAYTTGLLLLLLGTLSCSETKMLTKSLNKYPQHLGYDLISPIDTNVRTDSVILTFSGYPMDSATSVKRVKGLLLPFILINISEYKYRFRLGATQFKEDYNDFFFNALMDESDRSGRYALCFDSTRMKDVYRLDIRMDSCLTETHLMESTFILFYVYGYISTYSESSYPARSTVSCQLKLSKGDQVLKDTTISVSSMRALVGGNEISHEERIRRTAACMVETLCQSTRDCISAMVDEVNAVLKNGSTSQPSR